MEDKVLKVVLYFQESVKFGCEDLNVDIKRVLNKINKLQD